MLDYHVGKAAIGRRIAAPPCLASIQRIGQLILRAAIDAHLDAGEIDFAAIPPRPALTSAISLRRGRGAKLA